MFIIFKEVLSLVRDMVEVRKELASLRGELKAFHTQWAYSNCLSVQPPVGSVPICNVCEETYTVCKCWDIRRLNEA